MTKLIPQVSTLKPSQTSATSLSRWLTIGGAVFAAAAVKTALQYSSKPHTKPETQKIDNQSGLKPR